jgi:mannose-1-phosphate guanylyltransferase
MKAFLLAAGLGTRLRPLTDTVPKCLLPVGAVPLLSLWMQALESIGVEEVLINTHHLPDQVRAWAATQSARITLSYEPELLGSGGTLHANRQFVGNNESFLIIYADMWVQTDLRVLIEKHTRHPLPLTLGVYRVKFPRESGIALLDDNDVVVGFEEKPQDPKSPWANAGIMIARSEFLGFLPDRAFSDLSIDVLPELVSRMMACRMEGIFHDIGTPERYAEAQRLASTRL